MRKIFEIVVTDDLVERFWQKVDKSRGESACWAWIGNKSGPTGYGSIRQGNGTRRNLRAHRVSYAMRYGATPTGLLVCHKCDNPSCVNPEHLFLGTAKENSQDMVAKERNNHPICIGEKNPNCKITVSDVIAIRAMEDSQVSIASKFGITNSTVWAIKHRRIWKHL